MDTAKIRQPADGADLELVASTAVRLVDLLSHYDAYRSRWEAYACQHRGLRIHQGAVAQVIAAYLWDSGEEPETARDLPRRLKDVVSRALAGRVLATRTLRWFIEAFDMSPIDASELWALRSGRDPSRLSVIRQTDEVPLQSRSHPCYQTIAVHEFHTVGADGIPIEHRTVHVIRALEELQRYPYRFDTDAAVVEVMRGGTAGPLYRTVEDGLYAVDIIFHRPLQPGETGSFEYRTLLSYRTKPPPEFRRGTRRRVDNVELHVQFHPSLHPSQIWWAIWDDMSDKLPSFQERVSLEPDGSVHRYIDTLDGCIVGFHWEFISRT